MSKKDQNTLFKKIKFMLDSLFVSESLVEKLSWRKLYRLLRQAIKYDVRYNFTKKELKAFVKNIKEINYQDTKVENIEIAEAMNFQVQTIVDYVFHFIFNLKENLRVNKFIDLYPVTIE